MIVVFYLLIFFMGASIGSFLPVVFYRRKRRIPLTMTSRSVCDYCGKPLDVLALIPVIGYLLIGGKSRCCGKRLPVKYPVFEFLMGMLFVIAVLILTRTYKGV